MLFTLAKQIKYSELRIEFILLFIYLFGLFWNRMYEIEEVMGQMGGEERDKVSYQVTAAGKTLQVKVYPHTLDSQMLRRKRKKELNGYGSTVIINHFLFIIIDLFFNLCKILIFIIMTLKIKYLDIIIFIKRAITVKPFVQSP